MGSVRMVHDVQRGRLVAQKRLSNLDVATGLAFKQEFRVLAGLSHENLVRVHELGQDEDGLYYLMEVVEGDPLDAYCRREGVEDVLPRILPQLLDALAFIHAHGVVHRDLKPRNVLVTRNGIVKVLDFGVMGRATPTGRDLGLASVAGSAAYMAPEQIRGERPRTASDMYALGCILFELFSGQPPFLGSRLEVLRAHLETPPSALTGRCASVPPVYAALCRELLEKDPSRRPSAEELLRRTSPVPGRPWRAPRCATRVLGKLVGREGLLADLERRLRRGQPPDVLCVAGPSGIGKSAILDCLATVFECEGWLVLRGEARPTERVAYNVLDGVVDDLARRLARDGIPSPEVQEATCALRGIFPLLAAPGSAAENGVKELVRLRLFGRPQAPARTLVVDSLHRLIVAARGVSEKAVLILDDFQWADTDSLALLSHLLESRSEVPLVIAALRDDVGDTAARAWVAARSGVESVPVPPLPDEALFAVVAAAARASGHEPSQQEIERVSPSCHGRPFLAEVKGRALASSGPVDLDDIVRYRTDLEQRLLGLLAAADGWIAGTVLSRLLARPLGDVDDSIAALQKDGLVRRGGSGDLDGVADLNHDGVRHAVVTALPELVIRAHDQLGTHYLESGSAPPERLVRHLASAGRHAEAAEHALVAARAAERQSAFGLAADMYEVATRVLQGASVRELRARALEKAGRHMEAARAWGELSADAAGGRRLDLTLREASALIAANRVQLGLDRLDGALEEVGDPPSHSRSPREVLTAATFALGPAGRYARRLLHPARARESARADSDVRIGVLLSFLDPMSGVRYLLRARDGYARAGEPRREALCDYIFAVLSLIGSRSPDVPLADRYVRRAEWLLARHGSEKTCDAAADFVLGLKELRRGRWTPAELALGRAAKGFEACGAVTERSMSASWAMMADVYRQDVAAMRDHLTKFRRELLELEGGIINAHVELLGGYLEYLRGDFESSWACVTRIVDWYSGSRPNVQRAGALLYRHMSDIYSERADAGRVAFDRVMREQREHRLFDSTYAGPFAMIGALLEANALRLRCPGASARRVEWFARRIDTSPPFVAGAGLRARAYAADALGAPELALQYLEQAERQAVLHERRIDAPIARFQRGLRLGGMEGKDLCDGARRAILLAGASEALLFEDAGRR